MSIELIGKCGFFCGSCPTYICGDCKGCFAEHQPGDCYTRDCTLRRELDFCGKCSDFPCNTILTQQRCTVLDKTWLEWKKREKQLRDCHQA